MAEGALGLGVLLGLGLFLLMSVMTARFVTLFARPPRRTYASAVARGLPGDPGELSPSMAFESWTFRGLRHELPVWDVRGQDASGPVVIVTHGWSDSRVVALPRLGPIAAVASRVVLWDLPGHGESPGVCRLGTDEAEDLLRLAQRVRDPGVPVVLYGFSMGSGISIAGGALAGEREPGLVSGVVAEAPYRMPRTPAINALVEMRVPPALAHPLANVGVSLLGMAYGVGAWWRGFNRIGLASRLRCPLLVVHGDRDPVCPIEDGRAIAAAARDGRFVELPGGDHVTLWTAEGTRPVIEGAVRSFLAEVAARDAGGM